MNSDSFVSLISNDSFFSAISHISDSEQSNIDNLVSGIDHDLPEPFKIGCWNVHGLIAKMQSASAFFLFLNTLDCFCLLETWVEKDYDVFGISARLSNFNLNWSFATRISHRGHAIGGILFGFKKSFKDTWKFDIFDNIVFLRNVDCGFLVVPIYFSPLKWRYDFERYSDFLLNFDLKNMLVIGDFNARTGQLDNSKYGNILSRKSKDNCINGHGHSIINFCDENDLIILNGRGFSDCDGNFTYVGNGCTVIDYALISRQVYDLVSDFKVVYRIESDHYPLLVTLKLGEGRINTGNLVPLVPRLNWKIQNPDIYKTEVFNRLDLVDLHSLTVNDAVNVINDTIREAAIKKKSVNFYEQKWFDAECLQERKKLNILLAKFKKNSSDDRYAALSFQRKFYFKLCVKKRRELRDVLVTQFDNISEAPAFWAAVRDLRKNDNFVSESIGVQEWFLYFSSLLNPVIECHVFSTVNNLVINSDLDAEFIFVELKGAVDKLKNNKAPGIDAIPCEFFKFLNNDVLILILGVINRLFCGEDFPDNFLESIIFPLHKKGDLAVVSNFRGISFFTSFYKIYTQMLLARLVLLWKMV